MDSTNLIECQLVLPLHELEVCFWNHEVMILLHLADAACTIMLSMTHLSPASQRAAVLAEYWCVTLLLHSRGWRNVQLHRIVVTALLPFACRS